MAVVTTAAWVDMLLRRQRYSLNCDCHAARQACDYRTHRAIEPDDILYRLSRQKC